MALPNAIKVKIRDHLRYGIAGLYRTSPAGGTVASGMIGYRFFQAYGTLEYRMNNMDPNEEAMVTGAAVGAVAVTGPNPNAGDTFTLNFSGGGLSTPVQITVTAAAGDQPVNIIAKLAAALIQNQTLQLAGFTAAAPFGSGPFAPNTTIPLPECSVVAPAAFTLQASCSSISGIQVTAPGEQIGYTASLDGRTQIFGFIPILDGLKGAIASASQNFDTRQADVWKGRASELALRTAAYETIRVEFANFMGVPMNEKPAQTPGRTGYLRVL